MAIEQAWLPEMHLTAPKLAQPFAAILKMWCENWFADERWTVGDHWFREMSRTESQATTAFELENGLQGMMADQGKLRIAASMLALPVDKGTPARADAQLIAKITEKALADLGDRLATLSMTATPASTSQGFYVPTDWPSYRLNISCKGQQSIMWLRADRQLLVSLAQSLAPPPRTPSALGDRNEAVEMKQVSIGARIGTANLTLAELQGLGIGDVIALDRPLDSSFGLTVDGMEAAPSALLVKAEEDILQLQLTRSLS